MINNKLIITQFILFRVSYQEAKFLLLSPKLPQTMKALRQYTFPENVQCKLIQLKTRTLEFRNSLNTIDAV